MDSIVRDSAPIVQAPLQDGHYISACDRAGSLVDRCRLMGTRHRGERLSKLAELADAHKLLKGQPHEYNKFIDKYYKPYTNKKPRGRETSYDLLYCATGAADGGDIKQAGIYARAVDYMVTKRVLNFHAFLKERTLTGVLELARQDKRPAISKDERPHVKLYFDEVPADLLKILADSPHEVEFYLDCRAGPGPNAKITATPSFVSRAGQIVWTNKLEAVHKPYRDRTARAQQDLLDEIDSLSQKKDRRTR